MTLDLRGRRAKLITFQSDFFLLRIHNVLYYNVVEALEKVVISDNKTKYSSRFFSSYKSTLTVCCISSDKQHGFYRVVSHLSFAE